MKIFRLKANDGSQDLTVRHRCESCARNLAATNSREEGPRVWRDPALSSISVIEDRDYSPNGGPAILDRVMAWTQSSNLR